MNSNILLDVAELALKHVKEGSTVDYVDINELYQEFENGKTLCKSAASFKEFRLALETIFPIYKNKRKHTQLFKISTRTAYSECDKLLLILRPLAHIMRNR